MYSERGPSSVAGSPQRPYTHQRHVSSPRAMNAKMSSSPSRQQQQQYHQQEQRQYLPQTKPHHLEKENAVPVRPSSPSKKARAQNYLFSMGRSDAAAHGSTATTESRGSGPLGIIAAVGRSVSRHKITNEAVDLDEEFERLMSTLEVPESMRSRLLNMSDSVKESMIKGQTIIQPQRLRSGSMPGSIFSPIDPHSVPPLSGPSRSGSSNTIALQAKGAGAKEVPEFFATHLKATDVSRIDVARVRRLRVLLGSESPAWASDFISHQGMAALCRRMQELIDMEWREEQHDDQLLHEILRCLSVLSKTDRGKAELNAQIPEPLSALVGLVFSEKKPGDLNTRKLVFDLIAHLFSMRIVPAEKSMRDLSTLQTNKCVGKCTQKVASRARNERLRYHDSIIHSELAPQAIDWILHLVLVLISNPRTPETEAMLDFISASHTPRPFKTYILEVSGVCRDYFWIFCHSQNRYWDLHTLNVSDIESPKVPGGATGSVEFEAMAYLTSHLRLMNLIGSVLVERHAHAGAEGTSPAYDFYSELFASGIERVLAVLRKSSQVYYQPTHLELARFFHLAARARFGIPAGLQIWQAKPLSFV